MQLSLINHPEKAYNNCIVTCKTSTPHPTTLPGFSAEFHRYWSKVSFSIPSRSGRDRDRKYNSVNAARGHVSTYSMLIGLQICAWAQGLSLSWAKWDKGHWGVWFRCVYLCMIAAQSAVHPLHLLSFLLTQELEDGWKILVSVAARAHDSEDLMGKGTQRDGCLCVGGCVLGQTEIL